MSDDTFTLCVLSCRRGLVPRHCIGQKDKFMSVETKSFFEATPARHFYGLVLKFFYRLMTVLTLRAIRPAKLFEAA